MVVKFFGLQFRPIFFLKKNDDLIFIFGPVKFIPVCIVYYCLYMFVYRYHRLSIACPDIGMAWVQNLSITCPKIEHLDFAAVEWIVGRFV